MCYICSETDNIRSTLKITVNRAETFIFLWFRNIFHNIKIVRKTQNLRNDAQRDQKNQRALLGHHLHLPQESAGFFSCDSLRPPQFSCSRWPLMSLRRHPRKSVNLDARETVLVLKISARREKRSSRRKKSALRDFMKRNCARNERRRVTLRRSVRSTTQTATKDQNVDWLIKLFQIKYFFVVRKEITFLWAEWEWLSNNRKLNCQI